MSLSDFHAVEKDFEAKCKATASKLTALIDKRLAVIRKLVPGAAYSDSMGTSFMYVEGLGNNSEDPLYIATDYVKGERKLDRPEDWDGELPPHYQMAVRVYEKFEKEIQEIFTIAEYLYDEVGYTYT